MAIYNILMALINLDNYNNLEIQIKIILYIGILQEDKIAYLYNNLIIIDQIKIQLIIYKMILNYLFNFKVCIMIIINHQLISNYYNVCMRIINLEQIYINYI